MLFRKAICMSVLAFVAFAAPVLPKHVMNQKAPVILADGGGPAPPPIPLPKQKPPVILADGGGPAPPPIPLPRSTVAV
jgi:hypothetical protein